MDESNDRRLLVRGFEELYSEFLRDAGSGLYAIAVCPYQSDFIQPPILWSPSQIESMRNGEDYVPWTQNAWQTAIGQCRHNFNDRPLRSVAANTLETSLCGTTCVAGFVVRQDQTADESARLLQQVLRLAERACVLVQSAADEHKGQATGMAALSNWLSWLYAVSVFDIRLAGMFEESIAWRETWPSGDEYITSRARLEGEKPKENEWISRSYCRWVQIELHRDLFAASADTVRWIVERLNRRFSKIVEFKNLDHYWPKDRNDYLVELPFGIKIDPPTARLTALHKPFEHVRRIEERIQDWRHELERDHKNIEASINDYQRLCTTEDREAVAEMSKRHATIEAELRKIGWERPFATESLNDLDGIRNYLDQSAADLQGFAGTTIDIPEWRRSIYRNCARALNHYCKHLSHNFQVEDASKTADAETDGLLTRLSKWMEDLMKPPIARGPYLLGYAAGQMGGEPVNAWNAPAHAAEKKKWDDELVASAHKNGIAANNNQVSMVAVAVARHIGQVAHIDDLDSIYRMPVERVTQWLAKEIAQNPLCGYYNEVETQEAEWNEHRTMGGSYWRGNSKRYEANKRRFPEEMKRFVKPIFGRDKLREIELRHGVAPDDLRVYSIKNYKSEQAAIDTTWNATCEARSWPPEKESPDNQEWEHERFLWMVRHEDLWARLFDDVGQIDKGVELKSRRHLWAYIMLMRDGVEKFKLHAPERYIDSNETLDRAYAAFHHLNLACATLPKDYVVSPTQRQRYDELTRLANLLENDEAAELEKNPSTDDSQPRAAVNSEQKKQRKALDAAANRAVNATLEVEESDLTGSAMLSLTNSQVLAGLSHRYYERFGGNGTDREAYDWLRENGFDKANTDAEFEDLQAYSLPSSYETWARYVRECRNATGGQKYQRREGRKSRSVVRQNEL